MHLILTLLFTAALLVGALANAQANVNEQRLNCVKAGGHDVKVSTYEYRCDGLPTHP